MSDQGSKSRPFSKYYPEIFNNTQKNRRRENALDELTRLSQEMGSYKNTQQENPLKKNDE